MREDKQDWTTVIRSKSNAFTVNWRELWEYRDLMLLFVKRDIVSFYKQTVLGPIWFLVQPILTTGVFMFVFGGLAGLSTDGLPKPLFYLAGITAWNYFAECLTKTSTVFKDNALMYGKVYFPRLITPLSIVLSGLLRFAIQFLLFAVVVSYYVLRDVQLDLPWHSIYILPLSIVLMALLGLGLGLIVTALTTRYRDLSFLVSFGVQLLMYATTVIYPLSSAPESISWIIELNPMTAIIEAFRFASLGKGLLTWAGVVYSIGATFVLLTVGVFLFNRTERTFVDTI